MNDYHDIYIPEEDLEGRELGGYHDDGYDEEDDFFNDDEIRDQETGFCSSRPPKKRYGNKKRWTLKTGTEQQIPIQQEEALS